MSGQFAPDVLRIGHELCGVAPQRAIERRQNSGEGQSCFPEIPGQQISDAIRRSIPNQVTRFFAPPAHLSPARIVQIGVPFDLVIADRMDVIDQGAARIFFLQAPILPSVANKRYVRSM
ncbi:hypothetical protein [Tateyamaria sp.]|uniref:hypothetical protein n=1 Tax=Tateyamaria sp. TaxID=1929288 RepID=UPI003B215C0F